MKQIITKPVLIIISVLLIACEAEQKQAVSNTDGQQSKTVLGLDDITLAPKSNTNRWYFLEQAQRGSIIFSNNCAVCHGKNAEATLNWKTPDANGYYPPPPLNGSAHAWHHSLYVLGRTIYTGGAPVGGQMPAFGSQLSQSDIMDVIAHFQSYWSDEIYQRWLQIEKSARKQYAENDK